MAEAEELESFARLNVASQPRVSSLYMWTITTKKTERSRVLQPGFRDGSWRGVWETGGCQQRSCSGGCCHGGHWHLLQRNSYHVIISTPCVNKDHVNVKQTIMLDGSKYPRPYMFFLSFQERPLSWAPMLDSPPVCLTCAQFLQKKSYRWELARLLTSRRLLGFEPIPLSLKKLFKKRSNSRCPSCGWPMCGSKCAKASVHRWVKSSPIHLDPSPSWTNIHIGFCQFSVLKGLIKFCGFFTSF